MLLFIAKVLTNVFFPTSNSICLNLGRKSGENCQRGGRGVWKLLKVLPFRKNILEKSHIYVQYFSPFKNIPAYTHYPVRWSHWIYTQDKDFKVVSKITSIYFQSRTRILPDWTYEDFFFYTGWLFSEAQ